MSNGMLLSHRKEQNNAICSNMNGHGVYHNKWSKSDNANTIWYHFMWNLKKKWYKWNYLQNSNRLRRQTYGYQRGKVEGDKLGN